MGNKWVQTSVLLSIPRNLSQSLPNKPLHCYPLEILFWGQQTSTNYQLFLVSPLNLFVLLKHGCSLRHHSSCGPHSRDVLFSYTPCHLCPEIGWVSCSSLISSPTPFLPLILIKHLGSWELTPFPYSYSLLTSWPLSPEWPELLAQFSSSPQGLHHVHWAQVLHLFLHSISATHSQLHPGSPQKKPRTICEMSTETTHTLNTPPIASNHSLLNSNPPPQYTHTQTILWPYPSVPIRFIT